MLLPTKLVARLIFRCVNRCYDVNVLKDIQRVANRISGYTCDVSKKKSSLKIMQLSGKSKVNFFNKAHSCQKVWQLKKVHKDYTMKVLQIVKTNKVVSLQNDIKETIFRLIKVSIAHAMDPIQRSGETAQSNMISAKKYRRESKLNKKSNLKILMNIIFYSIFPIMLKYNINIISTLSNVKSKTEKNINKHCQRSF
ncbi:hypothetical protein [Candidatus Neoehrlichia procyonis]|uniref:Uncharacterized protein n=1 Tax=Candidatus Neoehrlichia procyonis str. RAC413 TaxID=1359163 RepID=A0A0F3NPL3_9RICK|nr:hypothetical protein [Candidatus Neoehrlichia lotoris]KJV68854.1 hypothetical protein NLO413_0222 [Candidatus Neoehrlichia lotoris str. RAC413]